ncbi:aldehyde dehydrogenase family protein [Streptomyces anulatus]|uniref:aldehyde dehydrogenase family protein n=1 Tax=Streptomyces anulatus TaxID=1892 RepID=UPI003665868D
MAETMEDVSRPLSGTARALITLEPLGVVAALTPFNGALSPGSWKLDPALAAGNTVILKPPRAPASSVRLAELALEAGFPPGVIGVVIGGAVEGRRLGARAAERMKRYVCEAGGKSAIEGYVDDALAKGARAVTGGKRATVAAPASAGFWYEPIVLADATPGLAACREEVFGPVVTVHPFDTEDEAVALANSVEYGLAAGFRTRDAARAHRVARRLEAGVVWVNTYRLPHWSVPFGGYKQSGRGRENGVEAVAELLRQSPSSPNTAPRPNRSATDPHLPRRAASGITHHQEQDASHGIPRQHPDHLA